MLKNLIIIEDGNEIQCDNIEEVVKLLIDEKFYDLSQEEKKEKIKIKALANSLGIKINIVKNAEKEDFDGKIIIKDEITYILSLLIINKILILENRDANIFTKNIDKNNISENYLILNSFAKEILINYLGNN